MGNILFVKLLKIENLVKLKLGVPQMATRAGFGYQCSGRFDDSIQISPPRQNGKVAQLVERWFEEPCQRKFDSYPFHRVVLHHLLPSRPMDRT